MNFLYYRTLANVLSSRGKALYLRSTSGRITRLTKHDDVINPPLGGAPRVGLALGPAPLGPARPIVENSFPSFATCVCSLQAKERT